MNNEPISMKNGGCMPKILLVAIWVIKLSHPTIVMSIVLSGFNFYIFADVCQVFRFFWRCKYFVKIALKVHYVAYTFRLAGILMSISDAPITAVRTRYYAMEGSG